MAVRLDPGAGDSCTRSRAHRRAVVSAGLAAAFAACATSGSRPTDLTCVSERTPHDASIAEAVDSTALAAALPEFWMGNAGLTLATLLYDSLGALDRVTVIAATRTGGDRDRMAEVVRRLSKAEGEPGGHFQLVLGDSRGPAPYRAHELKVCPPEILNRDFIARRLNEESRRLQPPINVQPLVSIEVQSDGSVSQVWLARRSGDSQVDRIALSVAREATWRPGTLEGMPFGPITIQFPVTFRPPGG